MLYFQTLMHIYEPFVNSSTLTRDTADTCYYIFHPLPSPGTRVGCPGDGSVSVQGLVVEGPAGQVLLQV